MMRKPRRAAAMAALAAALMAGMCAFQAWAEPPQATALESAATASAAVSIKAFPAYQDAALLARAWALPVASRYKPLIEYQRNATFCGPTSLANVLHSWGQAADQSHLLEGTDVSTVLGYLPKGLTLDELADVARQKLGKSVTVMRGLDLAAFRQHMKRSNDPTRRYVINFSRQPLFGSGGGHHSPIAGYLTDEDLVLVLDVNSDFGPWLVKTDRLWAAMNTVDGRSNQLRGLLLIE
ncbi:phytochelatin synthase family protein [Aquabacterium sp. NJ1]|uniref:phytochelatin synthase family protein n=1 Tax=Aquabacterium sp. NJ1 TaxID=1538295 RepID=UPI0009DDBFF7|nr:phytochelatin synthase family protein [Aquabacterium sp. NJ1]